MWCFASVVSFFTRVTFSLKCNYPQASLKQAEVQFHNNNVLKKHYRLQKQCYRFFFFLPCLLSDNSAGSIIKLNVSSTVSCLRVLKHRDLFSFPPIRRFVKWELRSSVPSCHDVSLRNFTYRERVGVFLAEDTKQPNVTLKRCTSLCCMISSRS